MSLDVERYSMASPGAARVPVTFDRRMRTAAETLGTFEILLTG
jgi:hypothetical protein